jgi:hypothetical protein
MGIKFGKIKTFFGKSLAFNGIGERLWSDGATKPVELNSDESDGMMVFWRFLMFWNPWF